MNQIDRPSNSYLFVPATRLDRVEKAIGSGAHQVILDLEDAVDETEKVQSAEALRDLVPSMPIFVRVNAIGSPWSEHDIEVCATLPWLAGVVLPKVESARDVEVLRARFPAVNSIIALIETHLGVLNSSEIAQAHPSRLAFGSVDYFARMGMEPTSLGSIFPLSTLVVASMAFGLPAPIDGPTLNLESEQTLRDDLRESKAIGAGAKMCVHPRQVELVNDYFSSDAHDVVWAQEIVDLARQHVGVFVHQGKMIDEPIVERARRILNDG